MAEQVIDLNVGGVFYTTTLATLLKHESSMIAQMFNEPFAVPQDASGRWFIDRNGKLFGYVLDYLRDGVLQGISVDDGPLISQLASELAHYGLPNVLPFEELFTRNDLSTYTCQGGSGNKPDSVPSKYTHILVQSHNQQVVKIEVPQGHTRPRPSTKHEMSVLDHYGSMGYTIASTCTDGGVVSHFLSRDASSDLDGSVSKNRRMHPTSDKLSRSDLPPGVLSILSKVQGINNSAVQGAPSP
eukprot:TRINITY_DN1068_c0_g1_i1.p1 TRINITY_DN1068_c0_g1~~TRINITY_DN1068_c0_g1_i1.p1  ORF type:complete len:242 (+),score=35.03 TRINITY_DN1068_c0_g1_i1:56-781(+)